MSVLLFIIAAYQVLGALLTVGRVGKVGQPTAPSTAVVSVLIQAFIVTVLVLAALEV